MKIAATIQARVGSTRLPGKVMKEIMGKPMLALQVERIQQSRLIDEIIIATSGNGRDDAIAELARELGVGCYRGSENDVLARITGALREFRVDIHVEFMGDSPLPDPLLVDSIVGYFLKHRERYDYVTNALKTTYPPGAEVYVYPSEILFDAESRTKESLLREHVGLHINQHPDRYRICNLEAPPWYRYPDYYLEVDTDEDFALIENIFKHFYPNNRGFSLAQVIDYLNSNPKLALRNQGIVRRWKAFRKD